MDAVEYLKERARMIATTKNANVRLDCKDCESQDPETAVKIVERWSQEHPRMTNAQKFEEVFGDKPENMCPASWWDAEYKAPEVRDG